MKVLWYEITVPAQYVDSTIPIAGWQDSLQTIVSQHDEIDLYIAFEGKTGMQVKKDKNVTYIPLIPKMSYGAVEFFVSIIKSMSKVDYYRVC